MTTVRLGVTPVLPVFVWATIACGESGCEKTLTCGSVLDITHRTHDDAGIDGSARGGGTALDAAPQNPPACAPTPAAGCVPAEDGSIFVDPSVEVTGEGSKRLPVKTIQEAIDLVREKAAARVILCNGVYDEQVEFTQRDTVRALLGGFNCDSWVYNPEGQTLIRPATGGFPLRVSEFTGSFVVADVTFEAVSASQPGKSSIAAFVVNSSSVQFRRVQLIAHEGQAGKDGVLAPFVEGKEWPVAVSLNGDWGKGGTTQMATSVGGEATEIRCPGGEVTRGGFGGADPEIVGSESGLPMSTGGKGAAPSSQCDPDGCMSVSQTCRCVPEPMVNGLDADPSAVALGARVSGTLARTGWSPSAGVDGAIGHPGGGGAGGNGAWAACDAYRVAWFGGGGGAAGGCGGNGGTAGTGGGASVALLILNSQVAVAKSTLIGGNAGAGGKGAPGQDGQSGGTGGGVVTMGGTVEPCAGGNGGKGGRGGAGGGGAGGISAAIVWSGNEPAIDAATALIFGTEGAAGVGGIPGIDDGLAGVADGIIQVAGGS